MNKRLYAVRDKETGKLVSDLTSPRKKFWQRKDAAITAMTQPYYRKHMQSRLELVCFELVEVKE